MNAGFVSVTLVTHNSERYVGRCVEAVLRQEYAPFEVIVVDNKSHDDTIPILERFGDRIRLIRCGANTGFASGQNLAMAEARGKWMLTLNPDVLLEPGFIAALVEAGEQDPGVGAVCGKLLRIGRDFKRPAELRIDSTGIYFTPAMRHFDRGWNEPDDGRFNQTEYVFGACAAAALYRRAMIEDVSLEDGFFDPDFFAYREDADVAWRMQLLGWRCLYVPAALSYHVRSVTPGPRRPVPPLLRMHSVKNRFLLRMKNVTGDLYRRHWPAATARDLLVIAGCLFAEPSSLPAFWRLARCAGRALEKRRAIMARRRASDQYLANWFQPEPASESLEARPSAETLAGSYMIES